MHNYPWIENYCLSLLGTEMDYKVEWSATRFMVCGKMFAMQGGDKSGKLILSLKLKPENGLILREKYPEVIPGYYLNKTHWNSIYLEGTVPDDVLKMMISESYDLIYNALTKKQKESLKPNRVGGN